MGAKVVGMSHNDKKKDVALELGADEYVVISDSEALAKYKHKFFALVLAKTFNNVSIIDTYIVKAGGYSNYNKI